MNRKHVKYSYILLQVLWIVIIFSFSLQSGDVSSVSSGWLAQNVLSLTKSIGFNLSLNDVTFMVRKTAHFSEYAILGLITYTNIVNFKKFKSYFLISFAVPFLDELLQHFINGRYGSPIDSMIDLAGLCSGMLIAVAILTLAKNHFVQTD